MHKEEFFDTLIGDEFIAALIAQVKTIFKHIKIEEINLLIAKIEEGILSPKKEMTRFSDFLIEKLKSFIESEFLDDEDENLNLNHSNISEAELTENIKAFPNNINSNNNSEKNNTEKNEETVGTYSKNEKNENSDKNVIYYTSCNKKISFSMSTQIANEKPPKIGNDVGLDELLEYIAADENPKKANKKKAKKKKNGKGVNVDTINNAKNGNNLGTNTNNINKKNKTSTSDNQLLNSREFDQEIEMFKNSLKNPNNISLGKKIRPNLSQEWLDNILKMVNASQ
jgi:hypothetical protein